MVPIFLVLLIVSILLAIRALLVMPPAMRRYSFTLALAWALAIAAAIAARLW